MKTIKKKVAKRQKAQPQPVTPTAPPASPAPISVTLSPQTSELVRWYCAITHHHEAAAIEGAVHGVFERAKADYEHPGMGDGFDWLMDDVLSVKFRDTERKPSGRHVDYRTVHVDLDAAELLRRYQQETGRDLRDIASAALVYALKMTFNPMNGVRDDCRKGEAWQYFEEEVQEAAQRRQGLGEEAA